MKKILLKLGMTSSILVGAFVLYVGAVSYVSAAGKTSMCHIPPDDPDNFHTITINERAVNAHLNHGDLAGSCNTHAEQLCDDNNACTIDEFVDGTEQCVAVGNRGATDCDDGDPNTTDSCDPQIGCINTQVSMCGNGVLDPNEEVDPPPGPFASAPVSANNCRYDFSNAPQLYCNGTCTWGGSNGCDQLDADAFCKLKTDNVNSTATSFTTTTALPQPGFACPFIAAATDLGTPFRGVSPSSGPVRYQDSSILANHGAGIVINSVVCTDP